MKQIAGKTVQYELLLFSSGFGFADIFFNALAALL